MVAVVMIGMIIPNISADTSYDKKQNEHCADLYPIYKMLGPAEFKKMFIQDSMAQGCIVEKKIIVSDTDLPHLKYDAHDSNLKNYPTETSIQETQETSIQETTHVIKSSQSDKKSTDVDDSPEPLSFFSNISRFFDSWFPENNSKSNLKVTDTSSDSLTATKSETKASADKAAKLAADKKAASEAATPVEADKADRIKMQQQYERNKAQDRLQDWASRGHSGSPNVIKTFPIS